MAEAFKQPWRAHPVAVMNRGAAIAEGCTCKWHNDDLIIVFSPDCPVLHRHYGSPQFPTPPKPFTAALQVSVHPDVREEDRKETFRHFLEELELRIQDFRRETIIEFTSWMEEA